MHRTIGYLSKRFVHVRPGEWRKVLLTFTYFFLLITSYYVIKPASRSLVLGELGSRLVPYADLVCVILMGPVIMLFARLVDRLSRPRLVAASFWVAIGILVCFCTLLRWPVVPWVAGAFYIWVSMFSVVAVTLFWLVANDLYRPREAKRLFGLIGSGGILGGIVGSALAAVGAQLFGTPQLLLLSAGLLVVCWAVVRVLWRYAPEPMPEGPVAGRRRETVLSDLGGVARQLVQSRYLTSLVVIVALNKIITTLVYYRLNPLIEHTFLDADARTTFTSMLFGGMNILAFVVQFFLTSWVLRRWGLLTALLALPVGLLCGATAMVVLPLFWVAAVTELYDGSFNYSLQQTAKDVLYLPIDRSIRSKVKPFIDTVVFRFGKGVAAVIGIILLDALRWPADSLSYVAIPCLGLWLVFAVRMRREYIATIRTMLQARAAAHRSRRVDQERVGSPDTDRVGEWVTSFGSLADGHVPERKLSLLSQLMDAERVSTAHARELLTELDRQEHRGETAGPERDAQRLKAAIWDQREPIERRCQAIQMLTRWRQQDTVDYLIGLATVEIDVTLRQAAVLGLVRLRLHGRRLEFPIDALRRLIAREVASYQRIVHVTAVLRQHHPAPLRDDDLVLGLFRVLAEESVTEVFRLLLLLYRPEDIHLIYEQVRESDPYVRADAVELLENLVDPWLRVTMAPILDENRFLESVDAPAPIRHEPTAAYRVLQDAIWDHNCWLSVTTLCAVGRLRLTTMRQELEKASRYSVPVMSKAARAALSFSATT